MSEPCTKTPGCPKPARHTGRCPSRRAMSKVTLAASRPAAKVAEMVYSPPPVASRTLAAPVAPAVPTQSQIEIKHVQGAELVHVATSNPAVARQALALIELLQAQ